ncbi:hypothetical protein NKH36_29625 [Mesorhizobium sp. M1312]|uniref:hypothetical protein n=1 Tax=unclassified Mesorhizobium TaxID=325217 RepID=UPI00333A8DD9
MPRNQVIRRRIFVGCEGDGERSYITLVSRILNDVHQRSISTRNRCSPAVAIRSIW